MGLYYKNAELLAVAARLARFQGLVGDGESPIIISDAQLLVGKGNRYQCKGFRKPRNCLARPTTDIETFEIFIDRRLCAETCCMLLSSNIDSGGIHV